VPRDGSRPLTVGAVVQELAPEFPDITISKVRFLEAEGLVTPTRTAAGYRQFTGADVERLRYVLRAQRDLFWPLRWSGKRSRPWTAASRRPPGPLAAPDPRLPRRTLPCRPLPTWCTTATCG
jgi:hypothetical protein